MLDLAETVGLKPTVPKLILWMDRAKSLFDIRYRPESPPFRQDYINLNIRNFIDYSIYNFLDAYECPPHYFGTRDKRLVQSRDQRLVEACARIIRFVHRHFRTVKRIMGCPCEELDSGVFIVCSIFKYGMHPKLSGKLANHLCLGTTSTRGRVIRMTEMTLDRIDGLQYIWNELLDLRKMWKLCNLLVLSAFLVCYI